MNKLSTLTLISMAVALGSSLPAHASSSDEIATKVVKVPVVMSALVAGMAIGTPIAVVQDSIESVSLTRDSVASEFSGNQEADACQNLVAGIVAVPAGLTLGLINGTYHGLTNAIENCDKKPFSAESFSLKDGN
ncbi:MAG: hypothetical protein K2X81_02210 [Candidatus Obscuribacterales bacterium]|nr:hypothetical protein [Candidatus Obscuribacterales bacterium]